MRPSPPTTTPVFPGRLFHFSHSLGPAPLTDVAGGTFAIALGVSQGADHHLTAGQAVAGVEAAQAALGVDVLGLDDLERARSAVRLSRGWVSPFPTPSLTHFYLLTSSSFPQNRDTIIPVGIWQKFGLITCAEQRGRVRGPATSQPASPGLS